MSTYAYATLTGRREDAEPTTSTSIAQPGMGTYVDALAALVPSEVLSVHALILSFTTQTTQNAAGESVTTITDPRTLIGTFLALIGLSIGIYVLGHHGKQWDIFDWGRMIVPACAFVFWTMLQKSTAFDAIAPQVGQGPRTAIAVIGAIVLGGLTSVLATKADQKTPLPTKDSEQESAKDAKGRE